MTTYDAVASDELGAVVTNDRLSVLGQLSEVHDQIVEQDLLVLPVPRWQGKNPEIFVRYKPVDHSKIRAAIDAGEKAPKQRRSEVELNSNIDVLIAGCTGVFGRVRDVDGEWSLKVGEPDAEHTTFDRELARNLGIDENATARQVVRRLFISEGDIMSHVGSLAEFSGYREAFAAEAMPGE